MMRGIASLLVVLSHIAIKGGQYGNGALQGFDAGGAGVDLFFIISGYIMCVSTYGQPINFIRFIIRRIKRIMPLYWLFTTVALVIFLYKPSLINSSGGETGIFVSYILFPNGKKFLNANGWTLSYEFFYYFILGFFLHKGTQKAILASSSILIALTIIGLCINFTNPLLFFSTDSLLMEFVFGMGCFYLFHIRKIALHSRYGAALLITGILLFAWQIDLGETNYQKGPGIFWGVTMLLIFIGLLSFEDRIQRASSVIKTLFLEIGNSSYSLYLVHPFTLSGTAIALQHIGMASNPWLFTVLLLSISITIGHLVYLYVERPLIALLRR